MLDNELFVDFTDFFPFAPEVGYPFLSLVSFFGSLIPFVPVPHFIFLATMAVGDQFNIHILALLSAVTATAAKQIIFYASYTGRRIIREETKRSVELEQMVSENQKSLQDLEMDTQFQGQKEKSQ